MSDLILLIIALILGLIGALPATGPVSSLVLKRSIEKKYSSAVSISIGASIAETIYCMAGIGLISIISQREYLHFFIKILSSLFFISLGAYFIFYNLKNNSQREKNQDLKLKSNFVKGFIFVILNPSVILTWAAISSLLRFYNVSDFSTLLSIIGFAISAGVGAFLGLLILILVIRKTHSYLSDKIAKILFKSIGAILIFLGILNLLNL